MKPLVLKSIVRELLARRKVLVPIALATLSVVLAAAYYYSRPDVYKCQDLRSKLPVFFEIESSGLITIAAHDQDGQVYAFTGDMPEYSKFRRHDIFFQHYLGGHASLSMKTGSFYITEKRGDALYSGICKM